MWKSIKPTEWLKRFYERTLSREQLYPWTDDPSPHAVNVAGDFYVVDACCTMCGVPFEEAPELFDSVEDERGYTHCFVKKQPANEQEQAHMINAIRYGELRCIRYGGKDQQTLASLAAVDELGVCDFPNG
ncbi:MAG: hypothetical protein WD851_21570 [Pirellulales bacterium]